MRLVIPVVAALLVGLVGFFLLIPSKTDFHSGPCQNESAAIGSLRTLNTLETQYRATHPEKGLTCELSLLDSADATKSLLTGVLSGYRFEISGCEPDTHGVASHYRATAVPLRQALTGIRAFCSDESGRVFYDPNGSAEGCLSLNRPI